MKKSNLLIVMFLMISFISNAQRMEKEVINHDVYGPATLEIYYDDKDVLRNKIIYTTDSIFTKGNLEVGELFVYNEKGNLTSKGSFYKSNKKDLFGVGLPRKQNGLGYFFDEEEKLTATFNYKDGLVDGAYTYFHKDGKVSHTGNNAKGKTIGNSKAFFNTGQLHRSVIYKEGMLYKVISFLDINGNKISHGTLKNGNGTLKYYDLNTGEFVKDYTYIEGKRYDIQSKVLKTAKGDVIEETYKYNNGKNEKIVRRLNDELEGVQERYNLDGFLCEIITYTNGIRNGEHKKYNQDGTLFFSYNYVDGKKKELINIRQKGLSLNIMYWMKAP